MLLLATLLLAAQGPAPAGLPVHEVPSPRPAGVLALVLSGDGGWAEFDRGLAGGLAARGVSVVGVDSRAWLHEAQSPETVAAGVTRILRWYQERWNASRFVLVGYSRGADLLPFAVNRLPDDLRGAVERLAFVGLAANANFKFHWEDVVRDVRRADDHPTRPEVERLPAVPVICFYGENDRSDTCRDYPEGPRWRVVRHGGGHRATAPDLFVREILAGLALD